MAELAGAPADLRAFIAPSDSHIAAMWRAILERRGDAKRADFLPVETALCFAFGLVTEPSPSGHVNVRKSAPEVRKAAALFGRTPSSLQSKHANLEARPGRDGGRRTDAEVGRVFGEQPQLFARVYERILEGARSVGISAELLPDFLGARSGELAAVLHANRALEADLGGTSHPDAGASGPTEATQTVVVRLAQQRFARAVLSRSNFACVFCGLSPRKVGLPSARLLVAGHIKPWRLSDAYERVSSSNGFAACPTHDAAFEAHLFTVDDDGRIVLSDPLRSAIATDHAWAAAFAGVSGHILLPTTELAASSSALEWHRARSPSTIEGALSKRVEAER